jgi:hypothetical protein
MLPTQVKPKFVRAQERAAGMRRLRRPGLKVLISCTAAGCAPADRAPSAGLGVEVRDSSGVTIVQNTVSEPRHLHAVEVRRIGLADGPDAYLLAQVTDLAVSSADTVFVGNSLSGTVRVFDPQGEFVREFGGRGDGPNEVRGISAVWLTGDTVVVRERGGARKTLLFRTSGEFVRSWRGVRTDGTPLLTVAHGPRGWIVEHWPHIEYSGQPGDSIGDPLQLRLFDPDADTLGPTGFEAPRRATYITDAGTPDQALFRVFGTGFDDRGRFFRTRSPAYEIGVFDAGGRLTSLIRRSFEPRPISQQDLDDYRRLVQLVLDTITEYGPPGTIDDDVLREIEQAARLPLPDWWSPVRDLIVSAEGSVWAEIVEDIAPGALELVNVFGPAADDWLRPTRWDVFDPNGHLIGQIQLPHAFKSMAVRGAEITGVLLDALGVEYVVTYRAEG